jgi:hypothetical protein
MKPVIPKEHETRLLALGLVSQKLGGLVLTHLGKLRIAKDS